ncbi:MAG: class I SAM-dependent methyltransferase [Deltaproteobacteria bacterium]|nr:class I SAM-dependent methyltransferase [Deltaproteobacteria bacterium]
MNPPFMPQSRDEFPMLLNEMGLLGTAVEVGTNRGDYAEHFRNAWRGELLLCVDPWERGYYAGESKHDRAVARRACAWRLKGAVDVGSVVMLPFTSTTMAKAVNEESLDFVYIDGDHSYNGVTADLKAWWPLVKPGGIIAGHDWIPDGWRCYGDGPEVAYASKENLPRAGWPCYVQGAVRDFFGSADRIPPGRFSGLNYMSPEADGGWPSWWVKK